MGKIIFWGLIRVAVLIPVLWIATDYIDYRYWWIITAMSIYGVVFHPAVIQLKIFREENKIVLEDTICSQCKHFDASAVLCLKYDEHPTEDYIPCDGVDWEPI
ncbi:MAG: hypothetical protein QY331_15680 [Melioribacteraceae bacterium]|nr:hypothetical protein [Melioribacteraceae bacterium]WKZ69401.1 MAG: hypothetical protein QY331_15680 [Melioribacteraceae bacterium]